jgi:hypothetical protein
MKIVSRCSSVLMAAGLAVGASASGPEWVEGGDAGRLPNNAQNTTGEGPMLGVRGTLGGTGLGLDEVDMYFINIVDPKNFRVTTWNELGGFSEFNSHLWLFRVVSDFNGRGGLFGLGLLSNDDISGDGGEGASLIGQFSNDDSGAFVDQPGLYLLAITFSGDDALSNGKSIYNFDSRFEVSGPDGPGGQSPINGWTGSGGGDGELRYRVDLRGVEFANVPAPGALALVALAPFAGARRRRGA